MRVSLGIGGRIGLVQRPLNARLAGTAAEPLDACLRWLEQIPPACVGELHLAGHHDGGDIVVDDHGSRVCTDVWQIYRHAQQRFGGVPALVEWDTDIPPLAVLLDEAASARNITADALQAVGA